MFKDKQRVIYVDTDILFFNAPSKLWSHFDSMNSSNVLAMSEECWKNPHAFYFHTMREMNSGILLMDLEKMRKDRFIDMTSVVYSNMKDYAILVDQDVYNTIFQYFPEKLYVLPSEFNFARDKCFRGAVSSYVPPIVSILHGTSRSFHEDGTHNSLTDIVRIISGQVSKNLNMIFHYPFAAPNILLPNVVYVSAFQTFRDVELGDVIFGTINMTKIFEEKIDSHGGQTRLFFDTCKDLAPYLNQQFSKLSIID